MIPKPDHVLVIFDQGPDESLWFFYYRNVSDRDWSRLSRVHNKYINEDGLDPAIEKLIHEEFYWLWDAEPRKQLAEFENYPNFLGTDSTYTEIPASQGKTTIIRTGILP